MPFHSRHLSVARHSRAPALTAAVSLILAAAAQAADTPPQLVASFTRQVQPLILNKCAAGACHGGPSAHSPRFHRGDVSGRLDRGTTLANIESLTKALGPHGNATAFLAAISRRHPAGASATSHQLAPLTTQERATLERWITAATGKPGIVELTAARNTASTPSVASMNASAIAKPSPAPNRFRAMLESAANPLPLPPPQEPKGILLGKERDE